MFDDITSLQSKFGETYLRLFGFKPVSKKLVIESVFVEAIGGTDVDLKNKLALQKSTSKKASIVTEKVYVDG